MQKRVLGAQTIKTLIGTAALLTTLTLVPNARAQRVFGTTDKNFFGVLDLGTGAFQNLGTTTSSTTGNPLTLGGLAYNRGNNLFYGSNFSNVIYVLDPFGSSGLSAAPQALVQGLGTNRIIESLAIRNSDNTLFALVSDGTPGNPTATNAALYTINLSTFTPTLVGSLGSNFATLGSLTIADSANGPVAYVTEGNKRNTVNGVTSVNNGAVFTVDLSSGTATRIASSATAGFSSNSYTPVAYGNQLYAADYSNSPTITPVHTYSVNQTTGAATQLSSVFDANIYGNFFALSTGAIPEPGTLALLAPALLGAGIVVRRRRKA